MLIVLTLLALSGTAFSQTTTLGTRYTTKDVQTFGPKAQHVFIASTCNNFDGYGVNVGILLFHNPQWIIAQGVVRFYVTNQKPTVGQALSPDTILCQNEPKPGAQPLPNCTVPTWNGSSEALYVVTTNGNVGGIDYSVLVEFTKNKAPIVQSSFIPKAHRTVVYQPTAAPTYLTQTIRAQGVFSLLYQEHIVLEIAFCPDSTTTKQYSVTSTVFGVGVHSAFNQYICTKLPCNPDSASVVADNPNEVALNVASATTAIGDLSKLYISIYCWGGDYAVDVKKYRGNFEYGAALNPR